MTTTDDLTRNECSIANDGREGVWHVYFGSAEEWRAVCAVHGRRYADFPRHKDAGCNGWHVGPKVEQS